MNSQQRIAELKTKIEDSLTPIIDNDYIYIDLPYYSNIGDTLIWQGAMDLLCKLPFKCLYSCSYSSYVRPAIDEKVIIIMHGGGNFGDTYRVHTEFRNLIIQSFPHNKIIILPQTVYYVSHRYLIRDAKIMREHPNLHICARDQYSFDFLRRYRFGNNILLLPDMAFCIDPRHLKSLSLPTTDRTLLFQRVDREKTDTKGIVPLEYSQSLDIKDWPGFRIATDSALQLADYIDKQKFSAADDYAITVYLPQRVKDGVEMISQYSRIYSNRLHGAILSVLLDKDVTILDNSYGKNSQFYDTWLSGVTNIHIYRSKIKHNIVREIKLFYAWLCITFQTNSIKYE